MKILNLYAGIGGNRKYWQDDVSVTAIEYDKSIAAIYKDLYPKDTVIVTDAHEYLLEHFNEYDFIWSSPPCQTHSRLNFSGRSRGKGYKYPSMKLYEEIILLQTFFKGLYCVENVKGYYTPLITPQEILRHYFWANFPIRCETEYIKVRNDKGFNLQKKMYDRGFIIDNWHGYKGDKRQLLNNCVDSEIGFEILISALKIYKSKQIGQTGLFANVESQNQ